MVDGFRVLNFVRVVTGGFAWACGIITASRLKALGFKAPPETLEARNLLGRCVQVFK